MHSPMVRGTTHRVALLVGVLALWQTSQISARAQDLPMLRGTVSFPDGTPVPGATVTATTVCDSGEAGVSLVKKATTTPEATFSIAAFGEGCHQYRLTANKREDFWLETGDSHSRSGAAAAFYVGPNGTSPTVDLPSATSSPQPITIVLGLRGGWVDIRVWDTAASRFIYAELLIERKPIEGKKFGSVQIATGKDGSADTLLLPPAEYVASVLQYQCGTKEYWAAVPPQFPFEVTAGNKQEPKIELDIRTMKSSKTYANPHGKKCEI